MRCQVSFFLSFGEKSRSGGGRRDRGGSGCGHGRGFLLLGFLRLWGSQGWYQVTSEGDFE